jgi:hypothetical protein
MRAMSVMRSRMLSHFALLGALCAGGGRLPAASLNFCYQFADSSGVAGGQVVSDCASFVNASFTSSTFGSYTGTAVGFADSMTGPWHLFTEVQVIDYSPDSYLPQSGGGILFAGLTGVTLTDEISVSGAGGFGILQFNLDLSGTLSSAGPLAAQPCYRFDVGYFRDGACATSTGPVLLESQPFALDGNLHLLMLDLSTVIFAFDSGLGTTYSADATADLLNTITLDSATLILPPGQSAAGVTIQSEGGLNYPFQIQESGTVPEPGSIALAGGGLILLFFGFSRLRRSTS